MFSLIKFFTGYVFMSAAWNMTEFHIIYLLFWLFGFSMMLSETTRFLEKLLRAIIAIQSPSHEL